jgi:hypothetical protein
MKEPQLKELFDLALARLHLVVQPTNNAYLIRTFPLPENLRCTSDDWQKFGDLNTERCRLLRTFTDFPQRYVTSSCERILKDLQQHEELFARWGSVVPELLRLSQGELERVAGKLSRQSVEAAITKSDFVTVPIDYGYDTMSTTALDLWRRSLEDVSVQIEKGCNEGFLGFLQIHSYLKNPICGLRADFERQLRFFTRLLDTFAQTQSLENLTLDQVQGIAAQAARESSFLSQPLLQNLICVSRQDHMQLPYVRVQLNKLGRAEFSVPKHVLEVAEEMLSITRAHPGQICLLVPIMVATCPPFSAGSESITSIIDGNHRATAAVFLKFLAHYKAWADHELMSRSLLEYCTTHGFGTKWRIDLLDVLEYFASTRSNFYDVFVANQEMINKFANVTHIPALLVQEEDFLTICKQRSAGQLKPVLLQPFHQTIFNDDDLPFALPQVSFPGYDPDLHFETCTFVGRPLPNKSQKAGQTHGRPGVFRLLPLEPFDSDPGAVEGEDSGRFLLRESMVGLA